MTVSNSSAKDSRIILEGQTVIHHNIVLTQQDRKFAEDLARENIIVIDELRQGIRIAAKWSWVGVLQFSHFELQIQPHLSSRIEYESENLTLLAELLDYVSDEQELRVFRQRLRNFDGKGKNLFELLIGAFANAVEEVIQRGLLMDYVSLEDSLPVVRGRLLMSKQIQKHFGQFERLECHHDEQTADIRENKLLLAALTVCTELVRERPLKAQLKRLMDILGRLASCNDFDFDVAYQEQIQSYGRLNFYYRRAHALASLVMDGLSHRTVFEGGEQTCFSFLFKMHEVFEKFVHKVLKVGLSKSDYKVYFQKSDFSILWNAESDRSYTSLRPDFVVENCKRRGVYLPIDAKYKNFDERKGAGGHEVDELATRITTPDIYQTFAYAHGFGHGQHSILPTCIVFYPSPVEANPIKRIHVRRRLDSTASGAIIVVPLNIKQLLNAFKTGQTPKTMEEVLVTIVSVLTR